MRSWIIYYYTLHVIGLLSVCADNLALLTGTLRTFQQAGCDDEFVTLKCPTGTRISIEVAQYGKSATAKTFCKGKNKEPLVKLSNTNTSCLWSKSLQYSLLQTVIEVCQKKQQCKFLASAKTFGGDPCPGERKYVEVAYKCRPYEFRIKEACENKRIELKCNPNSRVAVFSASFGRTEHENLRCRQPQGVSEETCLVSYATETVMQMCHGKRSCELTADTNTFGRACHSDSRMYLKVVYACVPGVVLQEQYEGRLEPDEMKTDHYTNDDVEDFTSYDSGKEFISEFAALPPTPKVQDQSKEVQLAKDSNAISSKVPPHAKTSEIESKNQEKFYLYLTLSVTAALLTCLCLLVGRLLVRRHKERREAKFRTTTVGDDSLPSGFADDISEVDAGLNLATPLPAAIRSGTAVCGIAEVLRHTHTPRGDQQQPPHKDVPLSLNTGFGNYYYG